MVLNDLNPAPGIVLENLSFWYDNHCLFQNLNLNLPPATCTCLLGVSGIGKSSLLDLMMNIALPKKSFTKGKVFATDGLPVHSRMMLMTQEDGLLPWLNVLENVLLGYRLRNNLSSSIADGARDLLNRLGLKPQEWSKYPSELSGGMKQRVALARTILEDKPILLLDEPFASIDAITRSVLEELLIELCQKKTVLMVTHDPWEALRLADQIYVFQGSPANLIPIDTIKNSPPRIMSPEYVSVYHTILKLLRNSANDLL